MEAQRILPRHLQDAQRRTQVGIDFGIDFLSDFWTHLGAIWGVVWAVKMWPWRPKMAPSRPKMAPRRPQMPPRRRKTTPRATTARWRQHVVRCPKTGPRQPKTARDCPRCPQDVQHGTARAASERSERRERSAADVCRCSRFHFQIQSFIGPRIVPGRPKTHKIVHDVPKTFNEARRAQRASERNERRERSAADVCRRSSLLSVFKGLSDLYGDSRSFCFAFGVHPFARRTPTETRFPFAY